MNSWTKLSELEFHVPYAKKVFFRLQNVTCCRIIIMIYESKDVVALRDFIVFLCNKEDLSCMYY